jgi:hypothetical protein
VLSTHMLRRYTGAALALSAVLVVPRVLVGQSRDYSNHDPYADRYHNGRYDAYSPVTEVEPGTVISVRTQQPIDTNQRDGRIYPAVVQDDVWDGYRRLAVPMIPRGSPAELLVHQAPDGDLVLDLSSVTVKGRRYAISTSPQRVVGTSGRRDDIAHDRNTPEYVGGGAILGTIIGAIAGGGKGAAIGAIGGAAAGAGAAVMTKGHDVRVPSGSVMTFRLEAPLSVDVRDTGYRRGDSHYHR